MEKPAAMSPIATFLALVGVLVLLLSAAGPAAAQRCGCQADECCSYFGYCGKSNEYCGPGCKAGPCWPPARATASGAKAVGSNDPTL